MVSQVERKQLFSCSLGHMWFALICFFTLALIVHVISYIQLLVDDVISLQRSLKLSKIFFRLITNSRSIQYLFCQHNKWTHRIYLNVASQWNRRKVKGQKSNQLVAVYFKTPWLTNIVLTDRNSSKHVIRLADPCQRRLNWRMPGGS